MRCGTLWHLDENGYYRITLKSTKPDIKPLELRIGYAEFSDIINCFDQLKNFKKIKINFNELMPNVENKSIFSVNKNKFSHTIVPPLIAFFSISIITFISIYFFEDRDYRNKNISIISNNPNIVIEIN